jgi:Reverse transcriptase (RNA-dependent DNA polymerase)
VCIPATLAWAPFCYGFSPFPWQWALNTMLEKQLNNFNVERLRAIALLESTFNHNNKLLGRQIMRTAEASNLVAQEQYGSRKFKECIDQMINKVLTTDFWRQMRQCGVICSTDLKSCYDRIVHSVATMSLRRWGADINTLQSAYGTLADLRFRIRTAFGDSEASFQGSDNSPCHGVCQGNGHGLATWACVSSP